MLTGLSGTTEFTDDRQGFSVTGPEDLPRIIETVVVEGRDDQSAVLAAAEVNVICTHGYGINRKTLDLIGSAAENTGIIIFTDPDHAGRRIRERLTKLFPGAGQAFLTPEQAEKDGDIGIENASPEDILRALSAAGCTFCGAGVSGRKAALSESSPVTMEDLIALGLAGSPKSSSLRQKTGGILGIGSANSKTFLKRLSFFGIDLTELEDAVSEALKDTTDS